MERELVLERVELRVVKKDWLGGLVEGTPYPYVDPGHTPGSFHVSISASHEIARVVAGCRTARLGWASSQDVAFSGG